jgi:hypothetical protein
VHLWPVTITVTATIIITITITLKESMSSLGPNVCAYICPKSMRSGLQIPLEKPSRRSALPKIYLFTITEGRMTKIINTMAVRHREIPSECWHLNTPIV